MIASHPFLLFLIPLYTKKFVTIIVLNRHYIQTDKSAASIKHEIKEEIKTVFLHCKYSCPDSKLITNAALKFD